MVKLSLETAFEARYAGSRWSSALPAVNMIGEHTDYNDGFVMTAAIQFATRVAVAARADREFALGVERVYGARMTGGGFGGATVNLVPADTAKKPYIYVRGTVAGAAEMALN